MVEEIVEVSEALFLNMKRRDYRSFRMVDPFASVGSFFPILRVAQVIDPPGVGPALRRPRFVNSALILFQEETVVGSRFVQQCVLAFD